MDTAVNNILPDWTVLFTNETNEYFVLFKINHMNNYNINRHRSLSKPPEGVPGLIPGCRCSSKQYLRGVVPPGSEHHFFPPRFLWSLPTSRKWGSTWSGIILTKGFLCAEFEHWVSRLRYRYLYTVILFHGYEVSLFDNDGHVRGHVDSWIFTFNTHLLN